MDIFMKNLAFVIFIFLCILPITSSAQKTFNNINNVERAVKFSRGLVPSTSKTLYQDSDASGNGLVGWFLPEEAIGKLNEMLTNQYLGIQYGLELDDRDKEVIAAIKENIDGMVMHVPELIFKKPYSSYLKKYDDTAIYELSGWASTKISKDDASSVAKFMK